MLINLVLTVGVLKNTELAYHILVRRYKMCINALQKLKFQETFQLMVWTFLSKGILIFKFYILWDKILLESCFGIGFFIFMKKKIYEPISWRQNSFTQHMIRKLYIFKKRKTNCRKKMTNDQLALSLSSNYMYVSKRCKVLSFSF